MADLTYQVDLNTREAQRQIDALEQQLNQLSQPIDVPITLGDGGNDVQRLRRELGQADDSVDALNRELDETEDSLRRAGRQADRTGSELESAGRRGTSAFSGLGTSILGFVTALGAIQGARAFLSFAGDAIDAASDLEESTSKASVVFGEFFGDIEAFASTAPQALGLANAEALEFAGTFGNLFTALGLSQQAAADLAPEIVQLGADLASFNNLEVTEALDKLRAGLVGEAEPLRALGVNLTAAATAAKAVELGLANSTSEVSEAAKVQARYALILEQTVNAQGDFARTADGIANTQRTLAGEFENLKASVGEALVPAFQLILDIAPSVIDAIENGLVPALAAFVAGVESVDPQPFVAFLSGLPQAASTVGTIATSAAEGLGNLVQVGQDFVTLDFRSAAQNFGEFVDDFNRIGDSAVANTSIQTLIKTLTSGVDPAQALESTLIELGKSVDSLTLDVFTDLVTQLVAMATAAGATAPELKDLADRVRTFGEAAGFSGPGVDELISQLLGPWGQAMAEASAGDIIIANLARSLEDLGPAADDAASTLRFARRELQGFADIGQVSFQNPFEGLETGLDAAKAALKDDENEIVSDFTTFLSNLESELAARAEFQSNIDLLEQLGLDDLAEFFKEAGLESAGLLADGLSDPAELNRAEQALERAAYDMAVAEVDAFAAAVKGQLDGLNLEPLPIPIVPDFSAFADFNNTTRSLIEGLTLPGGAGGQGGNTTIIVNSPEVPGPTIARIAQEVDALKT